jgi:hypothetical protein
MFPQQHQATLQVQKQLQQRCAPWWQTWAVRQGCILAIWATSTNGVEQRVCKRLYQAHQNQ